MTLLEEFRNEVKLNLKRHKLTQKHLSYIAGTHDTTIYQFLKKGQGLGSEPLLRIAVFFRIKLRKTKEFQDLVVCDFVSRDYYEWQRIND